MTRFPNLVRGSPTVRPSDLSTTKCIVLDSLLRHPGTVEGNANSSFPRQPWMRPNLSNSSLRALKLSQRVDRMGQNGLLAPNNRSTPHTLRCATKSFQLTESSKVGGGSAQYEFASGRCSEALTLEKGELQYRIRNHWGIGMYESLAIKPPSGSSKYAHRMCNRRIELSLRHQLERFKG